MPSDVLNQRDRGFDEWLEDGHTMVRLGYSPLLVVLRDERDAMQVHSPALGPGLANMTFSYAEDCEPGPPAASRDITDESAALEDDDSVMAFIELLEARWTDGFLPCCLLFVNDAGHLHSLADIEPEKVAGFLRWLSFEVAEGRDGAG